MNKKIVMLLIMILSITCVVGCNSSKIKEDNKKAKEREEQKEKTKEKTDATKFKEEYEELNGKKSESGKEIRTIEISSDNPFKYKEAKDIVNLMEKKESFIVYFGFNSCPWCRSMLPTLVSVAKDNNVDTIYYVDIKNIRDVKEVDKKGKVSTTKEGSDDYYKLLDLFDNVLSDYKLTDSKDKEVDAKEKRIYAPNIISVIDGKPTKLTTGLSDKQDDGYMELTDDMKKDMYESIEKVIKEYSNNNTSCNSKEKC